MGKSTTVPDAEIDRDLGNCLAAICGEKSVSCFVEAYVAKVFGRCYGERVDKRVAEASFRRVRDLTEFGRRRAATGIEYELKATSYNASALSKTRSLHLASVRLPGQFRHQGLGNVHQCR